MKIPFALIVLNFLVYIFFTVIHDDFRKNLFPLLSAFLFILWFLIILIKILILKISKFYQKADLKKNPSKSLHKEKTQLKNLSSIPQNQFFTTILGMKLFALSSLVLIYFSLMGYFSAMRKETYQIINTSPERAVLYSTNEKAICAEYDRNFHTISNDITVINLGGDPNLSMKFEETGRLRLKNTPVNNKYLFELFSNY